MEARIAGPMGWCTYCFLEPSLSHCHSISAVRNFHWGICIWFDDCTPQGCVV